MNQISKNKEKLINYFQKGSTNPQDFKIGLEIEHIVIDQKTQETLTYRGTHGIEAILKTLSEKYDTINTSEEHMIGLEREENIITLEPAGQMEIALRPTQSITEIEEIYGKAKKEIEDICQDFGATLSNIGYHPKTDPRALPLIPKKRYEYMDRYFKTTGKHGIDMMRGSASTQISLDYSGEEDFITGFRLANLLSPLLSLLTDNTPVFLGNPYSDYMARTLIWNHVDKDRSMIVEDALNKSFGFEAYADYILDNPAILILDYEGKPQYTGATPIKELYKDKPMTKEDIEHVISMFFPDVRLKTYLEIRMADSMPLPYVLGYIGLLKGIFYNSTNKKFWLSRLEGLGNEDVAKTKIQLMKAGYHSEIYGSTPKELLTELLQSAETALSQKEKDYLIPLKELVTEETTLGKKYNGCLA